MHCSALQKDWFAILKIKITVMACIITIMTVLTKSSELLIFLQPNLTDCILPLAGVSCENTGMDLLS